MFIKGRRIWTHQHAGADKAVVASVRRLELLRIFRPGARPAPMLLPLPVWGHEQSLAEAAEAAPHLLLLLQLHGCMGGAVGWVPKLLLGGPECNLQQRARGGVGISDGDAGNSGSVGGGQCEHTLSSTSALRWESMISRTARPLSDTPCSTQAALGQGLGRRAMIRDLPVGTCRHDQGATA